MFWQKSFFLSKKDDNSAIVKVNLILCIVILSFFLSPTIYAQDTISNNIVTEQIWIDYNPSYELSEKVVVYGDIGARTLFPHEWNRFVIRPSISYKLPKPFYQDLYYNSELHGGIGFFFTHNLSESNRLEIRPFQGFKLMWPNRPRIRIQHYARLEERFEINTANWENTFGLRIRYQAEMIFFLKGDWLSFNKGFYIPVSLELFWNLIGTKQFNDAARIIPGIGREFTSKWKGELLIGYYYTRNTVEDVFGTNDLVLRIRVYHKFSRE